MGFPELFEDYEKYHQQINTGKISRFDLVEQWLENGSNVLDVGIGDGSVAEHMMIRKQMKVCGLDISRIACERLA